MKTVSVVVPARNEQDSITLALRAVLEQDYPQELIEVVVVDGLSEDETADRAKRLLDGSNLGRWAILENPDRRTPSNLNRGLLWSEGELVVRVDARSVIPSDYIRRMVNVMEDPEISVVGGRQYASARVETAEARAIARALNNPMVNGGARYRNPKALSGACDTAYLGVFRRDQLNEVGGWSERFASNQDFELCQRMTAFGEIWYEAGLPVSYEPRKSFRELLTQYRRFGKWKAIYWTETGDAPKPRQLALLAVPLVAGLGALGVGLLRPRALLRLGAAGLGALLAVDHVGAESGGSPTERAGGVLAMGVIGLGWWTGAAQEISERTLGESDQ